MKLITGTGKEAPAGHCQFVQFVVLNANAGAAQGSQVSWPVMSASQGCPRETYRKQVPVVEYFFFFW